MIVRKKDEFFAVLASIKAGILAISGFTKLV